MLLRSCAIFTEDTTVCNGIEKYIYFFPEWISWCREQISFYGRSRRWNHGRKHEAGVNDEDNAVHRSTIRVPRKCRVGWQRHKCTRKMLLRHTVSTNYTTTTTGLLHKKHSHDSAHGILKENREREGKAGESRHLKDMSVCLSPYCLTQLWRAMTMLLKGLHCENWARHSCNTLPIACINFQSTTYWGIGYGNQVPRKTRVFVI